MNIRRFQNDDANELADMIAYTLRTKNIKDYTPEYIENDISFLRAKRIEIPASKTAVNFYRKMEYDFKNGITEVDDEQLYHLEKFR